MRYLFILSIIFISFSSLKADARDCVSPQQELFQASTPAVLRNVDFTSFEAAKSAYESEAFKSITSNAGKTYESTQNFSHSITSQTATQILYAVTITTTYADGDPSTSFDTTRGVTINSYCGIYDPKCSDKVNEPDFAAAMNGSTVKSCSGGCEVVASTTNTTKKLRQTIACENPAYNVGLAAGQYITKQECLSQLPYFGYAKYSGGECSGVAGSGEQELQTLDSDEIVEIIETVDKTTFKQNNTELNVPNEISGEDGSITDKIQELNPNSVTDVTESDETGGVDKTKETEPTPTTNVYAVTMDNQITGGTTEAVVSSTPKADTQDAFDGGTSDGKTGTTAGGTVNSTTSTTDASGNTTTETVESEINLEGIATSDGQAEILKSINEGNDANSAKGAVIGTDCETPPVCDDEKAFCAVIKQDWSLKCSTFAKDKETIEQIANDPLQGATELTQILDLTSRLGDITNIEINGSCPDKKPFQIFNKTYYLSFQPLCTFSSAIRPLILAFGLMAVITIIART